MEFKKTSEISEKEIYELAVEEAKLIGKTFSKEEIKKLTTQIVNPISDTSCIYGTLTGNCNSERSVNFIKNLPIGILSEERKIENLKDMEERSYYYMTPLEHYIFDENLEHDWDEKFVNYVIEETPYETLEMIKIIQESANN